MSEKSEGVSVGIGFWGGMFLVFLTLKLIGAIDWSWWIVTAPLWGPYVIILAIMAVSFAVIGFVEIVVKIFSRRKK